MAFQDVLVPTDFRPGSLGAMLRALECLGSEGGKIIVLHVIDQHGLEAVLSMFPEAQEADVLARLRQQAHARYDQLVADLPHDNVELEPLIVEGVPALKIAQFGRDLDVDLIVMTLHRGPEYFERFLFGSTAERVMRIAPCPVLIVPETMEVHESGARSGEGV